MGPTGAAMVRPISSDFANTYRMSMALTVASGPWHVNGGFQAMMGTDLLNFW